MPAASSRPAPTREARSLAAAAELEAFVRAITDAINRHDFESPVLNNLSEPQFHASELDKFPETDTWLEHMETFKKIIAESPEYRMDVKDLTVDIAPNLETADVFITAEISGRPPEVKRESLGVLGWRRYSYGWRCVSHVNMRQNLFE